MERITHLHKKTSSLQRFTSLNKNIVFYIAFFNVVRHTEIVVRFQMTKQELLKCKVTVTVPCQDCGGSGDAGKDACAYCEGTGRRDEQFGLVDFLKMMKEASK